MNRRTGHFPERDSEPPDSIERFDGRQRYDECARKLEECRQNLVRLCRISGGTKEFNDEDIEKTAMDIIRLEEEEANKIANELLNQDVLNKNAQETDTSSSSVPRRTKNSPGNQLVKQATVKREPEYQQVPEKSGSRKGASGPKPSITRKKGDERQPGPNSTESRGAMNSQTIHIRAGEGGRTDNPVHIIITAITGEPLQATVEGKSNIDITTKPKDSSTSKNSPEDSSCTIQSENEPTLNAAPINQPFIDEQTFAGENEEIPSSGKEPRKFECYCDRSRDLLKGSQKSLKAEPGSPSLPPHWQQALYQSSEPAFQQSSLGNYNEETQVENSCTEGSWRKGPCSSQHDGKKSNAPTYRSYYDSEGGHTASVTDESQLLEDICQPSNYKRPCKPRSARNQGYNGGKVTIQPDLMQEPVVSAQRMPSNCKSRSKTKCQTSDGDTAILLAIAKAAINLSLKKQKGEDEDDDCDSRYPDLLDTIFEK